MEKNKCYLVNLNSDPSLNEMLVYYLKEKTLVGRTGADANPDIQLSGVGIQDEHCEINVNPDDWSVTVIPFPGTFFVSLFVVCPGSGSPVKAPKILLRNFKEI